MTTARGAEEIEADRYIDEQAKNEREASGDQGSKPAPILTGERDAGSGTLAARIDFTALTLVPEVPSSFRIPFKISNIGNQPMILEEFSARFLASPEADGSLEPSGPDERKSARSSGNQKPSAADGEAPHAMGSPTPAQLRGDGALHCNAEQIEIPAGGQMIVICSYQPHMALNHFWDLFDFLGHWRTLTIKPGDYQVFAQTRLRANVSSARHRFVEASTIATIPLRPTIWQVVIGVGFGALILALFRAFSPRVRQTIDIETDDGGLGSWRIYLRFAQFWVSAWIAGAMMVFMTYRMSDTGFPISISVSDFYGGVVVGLFGYMATAWVSERVIGGAERSSNAPDSTKSVEAKPEI